MLMHISQENLIQQNPLCVPLPCYSGKLRFLLYHFPKSSEEDISLVF